MLMRHWKKESMFEDYIEGQEKLNIPLEKADFIGLDSTRIAIINSISTSFQKLRPHLEGKLEEIKTIDHLLQCFAVFRATSPILNHKLAYTCLVPLGEYCMWMPVMISARFASDPFSMVLSAYIYSVFLILQQLGGSREGSTFAILCIPPIVNINKEFERRMTFARNDEEKRGLCKALDLMHFAREAVRVYRETYGLAISSNVSEME
jgi:hypothetical protein